MKLVTLPVVCIQQFAQVQSDYLCSKRANQIHEIQLCQEEFFSPHHKLGGLFHPKRSYTDLSRKSLLLLD